MSASQSYQLEVFFDGQCPLCVREIEWLKRRDRQGKIAFTDIAAPDFEPASYGKTMDQFMMAMHGRLPDGSWTSGVETFQHLYSLLGLNWMIQWTKWPGFRVAANLGYRIFAANRLRFSRWVPMPPLPNSRASCRMDRTCSSGVEK